MSPTFSRLPVLSPVPWHIRADAPVFLAFILDTAASGTLASTTTVWSLLKSQYAALLLTEQVAAVHYIECSILATRASVPCCYPLPFAADVEPSPAPEGTFWNGLVLDFITVLVIALLHLVTQTYCVPTASKIRDAGVRYIRYASGVTALEATVARKEKEIRLLNEQFHQETVHNERLERTLCAAREERVRVETALQEKMSAEREKHDAALSQINDVVLSTKEQFELCGDALDKLRDDYTTEQASSALLRARVTALLDEQSEFERNTDASIASLRAQLQAQQQQHEEHAQRRAAQIAALEERVRENKKEYAVLVDVAKWVVKDVEEKEVCIGSLMAQLGHRGEELSMLRVAHTELGDAHQSLQRGFAVEQEESATNKREYEVNCTAYEDRVANLTYRLEHSEHQLDFAAAEYRFLVQDLPRRQAIHDAELAVIHSAGSVAAQAHQDRCVQYDTEVATLQDQLAISRRLLEFSQLEYRCLLEDLPRRQADLDSQISLIRDEYESTISSLRGDHTSAIISLGAEHDLKLSALREAHQFEVADIEARLHATEESLARAEHDCKVIADDASSQRAHDESTITELREQLTLMTVGRDVLAERCEKFEKELEELTERREIDAGRYQFLVYAFDDQSTRYEKTKAALDACRAGQVVDAHYTEMLETTLSEQQCRLVAFEASDAALQAQCATLEGTLEEMRTTGEEQRDEIEQLHELLDEASEEAMQASREAQEACDRTAQEMEQERQALCIERETLVQQIKAYSTAAATATRSPSLRQTEPSLFKAVLDRNLVARYEQALRELGDTILETESDEVNCCGDADEVDCCDEDTDEVEHFDEDTDEDCYDEDVDRESAGEHVLMLDEPDSFAAFPPSPSPAQVPISRYSVPPSPPPSCPLPPLPPGF